MRNDTLDLVMIQFGIRMPKIWKLFPQKYENILEQLLFNRGIESDELKEQFLNPKLTYYLNDLAIPHLRVAQERIKKAIEKQELIIIYGDYDVDGVCASAVLYKGLVSIGAKVLPYIPHREKEGYGLSKLGLEFVRDSGATLVITVDNGIVAFEEVLFAKGLGLDLIITDHHLPSESLPDALFVIHSLKMCGSAVAWCLIKDLINKDLSFDLLQFVAIATVCDMMPLLGLNRALVYEGLKSLNATDNIGLKQLMVDSDLEIGRVDSYAIGHVIGPRINAIGRLDHAIDALRLLCTADPNKARVLAKKLIETNTTRRDLTLSALDEARELVDRDKKIKIVFSKNWVPGIVGLIAARVCEEYFSPAIAISIGESFSRGSARSVKGVNIVEVIRECSDLLIDVGGHAGAAGFSIENKNLEKFQKKLEKLMDKIVFDGSEELGIEMELSTKELTKKLVKDLESFEPYGFENPKVLFASRNMRVSDIRTVGEGKHLKGRADNLDFIAFGMGDLVKVLKNGQLVDLAYYFEINRFRGDEILQLKVADLRLS